MTNKVTTALERIEALWYETQGKCFVSFSGGKDSTVILWLIKQCVELGTIPWIKAVFFNTGIELGATVDFVKECRSWYPDIEVIRPEKTFSWILENHGKPMKSKLKSQYIHSFQASKTPEKALKTMNSKQWRAMHLADKDMHILHKDFPIKVSSKCCDYLKKKPSGKYCKDHGIKGYILGERMAEGGARELSAVNRVKTGGQICTKTQGDYIVKLPIIDWSDEDIEEYIKENDVPLSRAYTEYGCTRTGCFGCPYSLTLADDLRILHDYEPNRYKASLYWLEDVYIAQGVELPFDPEYEAKRLKQWEVYEQMRYEAIQMYRPESAKRYKQTRLL